MVMEKESLLGLFAETGGGQATAVTSGANISADDVISLVEHAEASVQTECEVHLE